MYKLLTSVFVVLTALAYGQNFNIANNSTVNTVASNSYTNVSLGNNAIYNIQNPHTINVSNQVTTNNGSNITVAAGATLNIAGCLVANNNINLTVLGTLNVSCINMQTNGTITINGGGTILVSGNLTAAGGTDLIINFNGSLQVNGNVNINPSGSTTSIDGSFVIGGTYTGPIFAGNGTVTQGGTEVYPSALPITLTELDGVIQDQHVLITWTTVTEHNNAYFVLESSYDGLVYNLVTCINGAGNSTQPITYTYTDTQIDVMHPILYYKLHQVDYDGAMVMYPAIAVYNRIKVKYVLKYFNSIGQEVPSYIDAYFILYSDGSIEKVIKK